MELIGRGYVTQRAVQSHLVVLRDEGGDPISIENRSVTSGPDSVQSVTIEAAGGQFKLDVENDWTAEIPFGAPAATVQAAIDALPALLTDAAAVTVTGSGTAASPYLVTFGGILSGQSVPTMTADSSALSSIYNTVATSYDLDGEITSIGDSFSHYAYTFDGQGNVASVDNAGTPGVPDVVLASGYDAAGNRSSLSATIGGVKDFLNSYFYDTLSRLVTMQQVGQSGGNAVAAKEIDYGYDAIGDITGRSAYNFVGVGPRYDIATSSIGYNPLGLLTSISMTSDVGQVSLDHLTYSYDTLARVSAFGSIDGTAAYGYDRPALRHTGRAKEVVADGEMLFASRLVSRGRRSKEGRTATKENGDESHAFQDSWADERGQPP